MATLLPVLDSGPVRPSFAQGPRSLDAVRLLRLSITDRCNLRCVYCMPDDGVAYFDRNDLLASKDIIAIAEAAASVGVSHFKITGGEPTIRGDLMEIIEGIAALRPQDLSMTTNGLRLPDMAHGLHAAGLDRLTVSCDSLIPERFAHITGGRCAPDALDTLWRGLDVATDVGFHNIKINVVVMGGVNDDEVADFAALTIDKPWTVRFIEYMPLGDSVLIDQADLYTVDNAAIKARIEECHGPLGPVWRESEVGVGPASVFHLPGAKGRVGFISAMSKPFCETCNRLRLTARGELRSCLFDGGEVDVMPALRPEPDQDQIIELMGCCVSLKPQVHSARGNRAMSQLGG